MSTSGRWYRETIIALGDGWTFVGALAVILIAGISALGPWRWVGVAALAALVAVRVAHLKEARAEAGPGRH